jgi:hypothetical protein
MDFTQLIMDAFLSPVVETMARATFPLSSYDP